VREPLVHFLLLGGLLFGAWYAFNDAPQISDANRIVLDEAQVASLAASFQRTWLRLPTHEELAGLVKDRIREEILYREALSTVPPGQWSGPLASPYGLHLVYVSERLPAREPPLDEVLARVNNTPETRRR
jgi:hypothetical protein